jgi:hypothetical protein
VQEDDRRSAARLFEIEADVVACNGMGHFEIPLLFCSTRFLSQISPRNLRKLDSYANRQAPRIKSGAGFRLKTLWAGARKSQLMLAAAMRRD